MLYSLLMAWKAETHEAFANAHKAELGVFFDLKNPQEVDLQGLGRYRIFSASTNINFPRGLVGARVGEGEGPEKVFIKSMISSALKSEAAAPTEAAIDLAAFFREVDINRAFAGSGIRVPEIYGIGINNRNEAIAVMEYLEGPTLHSLIGDRNILNIDDYNRGMALLSLSITKQLGLAHKNFGLIHRDVKPTNIIIYNGVPIIVDWGIAYCTTDNIDNYHSNTGSIGYSPFEQYKESETGMPVLASDIFSLGVTLYRAFTGISEDELRKVHPVEMATWIEEDTFLAKEYPKLAGVIVRATMAAASDRYASMEELYTALTTCFADFLGPDELANPDAYLTQVFADRERYISEMPTLSYLNMVMPPLSGQELRRKSANANYGYGTDLPY